MKVVARMKIAHKLAAVVVALLLPLTYLGIQYALGLSLRIHEHSLADEGLHYFEELKDAGRALAEHASFTATILAGEANTTYFDPKIKAAAATLKSRIASQDEAEAKYGVAGSEDRALWQEIRTQWTALSTDWPKLTPEEGAARHTALSTQLTQLVRSIAESHHLDRDGDLQQFYLQDLAVLEIPRLFFEFGSLRAAAAPVAAHMLAVTKEQETSINALMGRIHFLLDDVRWKLGSLATLSIKSGDGQTNFRELAASLQASEVAFESYQHWVESNIVTRRPVGVASEEVMERGADFESQMAHLHDAVMTIVSARSAARLSAERNERMLALGLVGALVLASVYLAWYFTRGITRSMSRAVQAFQAIESGNYRNVFEIDTEDETGQVLRSLDKMQAALKSRIDEDRRALAETMRVRQALDSAHVIVVVLDEQHCIVYANEAARSTFSRLERDFRADMPGFAASPFVSASLDIFKPEPFLDRHAIDRLRTAARGELTLGGHSLVVTATPVFDKQGLRLGTVLEWRDQTLTVTVEGEVRRAVQGALAGNLRTRLSVEGKSGFQASLALGLNDLFGNLSGVVETIKRTAGIVGSGAKEIAQGNEQLASRTEQQASALEETSSALQEISLTVRQSADNVAHAEQLATAAKAHAEQGGLVIDSAIIAMQEINASSHKIAAIVGVIDAIAFQTNLLALNAAVESAHAGEQGRGFAVVAAEVRNLAGRSAAAAKEIKDLIQDSVLKVEEGSKLVDQSGAVLQEIVDAAQRVNTIVAEIAATTREQSAGIDEINNSVAKLDEMTRQNATLVEHDAALASGFQSQTETMNQALERYQTDGAVQVSSGLSEPRTLLLRTG